MFLRHLLVTCLGSGCQRGFDQVVGHARDAGAEFVNQRQSTLGEQVVKIAAGESKAVLEIGVEFIRSEGRQELPHPQPLLYTREFRAVKQCLELLVAHQDDIGAVGNAGIGGGQCFELRQRVRADSTGILYDDYHLGFVVCKLLEHAPEQGKALHRAGRHVIDAQFTE